MASLSLALAPQGLRIVTAPAEKSRGLFGVPRPVVLLGVVSFLTDLSSEAIFAVLPLFITGVLGAGTLLVGVMEGGADFAASSLDMVSGIASDRTGKRKALAAAGYGVSSMAKAVLLLAATAGQVVAFRVVERLGKSIRGAPRDALLAGVAPKENRGRAFGVHKAFDRAGAVAGPLVAYAVLDRMGPSLASFHLLFAVALVPAVVSVVVLVLSVPDESGGPTPPRVRLRDLGAAFGPGLRHYLVAAAIFSTSYFSVAFLLLAARAAGFADKEVALLYALFNVACTVASVPAGIVGDRIGRRAVVAVSYALYVLVAVGFALVHAKAGIALLFVVYGAFFAIDEGQTKAYVSDLAPAHARGGALGAYGFVTGVAYLPASLGAGVVWKLFGPAVTFGVAAAIAALAFVYLLTFAPADAGQGGLPGGAQ